MKLLIPETVEMNGDGNIGSTEIVEIEGDGNTGSTQYRPQFSRGRFRISLDSRLKFVVVGEEWSSTALAVSEARIF